MTTKYLVNTTEMYRIDNLEQVEAFHDELKADAQRQGYVLSSFSYEEKTLKAKGEVVDFWYRVKVVKSFENEKEPYAAIGIISYYGEAMNKEDNDVEEGYED